VSAVGLGVERVRVPAGVPENLCCHHAVDPLTRIRFEGEMIMAAEYISCGAVREHLVGSSRSPEG